MLRPSPHSSLSGGPGTFSGEVCEDTRVLQDTDNMEDE